MKMGISITASLMSVHCVINVRIEAGEFEPFYWRHIFELYY